VSPQRISAVRSRKDYLNEGASHTIECMCVAQLEEMSYIRHTYLVKGKTLCIQFVYMLGEGVLVCIWLV